jgi:hypothetical protein
MHQHQPHGPGGKCGACACLQRLERHDQARGRAVGVADQEACAHTAAATLINRGRTCTHVYHRCDTQRACMHAHSRSCAMWNGPCYKRTTLGATEGALGRDSTQMVAVDGGDNQGNLGCHAVVARVAKDGHVRVHKRRLCRTHCT